MLHPPERKGKFYRVATKEDLQVFQEAAEYLSEKRQKLMEQWGFDPVPDEPLTFDPRNIWVTNYFPTDLKKWGSLFNARQKLALITFVEKVREAHKRMLEEGYEPEFAKAVGTYLGLGVDRLVDKNSSLCRLIAQTEAIGFTYGRQALPMLWDYIEMNPIKHPSSWIAIISEIEANILCLPN